MFCVGLYVRILQAVRELRDLPSCKELILRPTSCRKNASDPPPSHWPISRLPLVLPRACTEWHISPSRLACAEFEAFMFALPADRTEPLHVVVVGKDEAWAKAVRERMARMGTYPNITVSVKASE